MKTGRTASLDAYVFKENRQHIIQVPLMADSVRAGFPSPADDYVEAPLDLIAHLVPHPSATFYVRAKGHSMTGAGIFDNDLLIVDRSLSPRSGDVVIAAIDGELTCKWFETGPQGPKLIAAHPHFPPIELNTHTCHFWGVVTHNIHALRPGARP